MHTNVLIVVVILVYDPSPDPTVRLKGTGGPLSDGLMHESDVDADDDIDRVMGRHDADEKVS